MLSSLKPTLASRPFLKDKLVPIRKKLARSMIGSTVDLLADSHTIAHGIVTGVLVVAGSPKIVVNGHAYDVDRVVTATTI